MDQHIVPGFRRLNLLLFNVQHLSRALPQSRILTRLIIFVWGRSPPKDSVLQTEKREEKAEEICTCAPALSISAFAAERVDQ